MVKCEDKNDIFTAHSKDIVNTSSHLRIPGSLFSEYEKTWYFIERVYENVVKTSSRNKRKQLILWYTVRTFENTEFKNNQQRTRSSEFGRYSEDRVREILGSRIKQKELNISLILSIWLFNQIQSTSFFPLKPYTYNQLMRNKVYHANTHRFPHQIIRFHDSHAYHECMSIWICAY